MWDFKILSIENGLFFRCVQQGMVGIEARIPVSKARLSKRGPRAKTFWGEHVMELAHHGVNVVSGLFMDPVRRKQETPKEIQAWFERSNDFKVGLLLAAVFLVFAPNVIGDAVHFFEFLLIAIWIGPIIAAVIYCRKLAGGKPRH